MNAETKKVLLKLEPFVGTHKNQIENLIKKLETEKEMKLPKEFEDKLKTIKNNPVDEEDIAVVKKELDDKVLDGEIDHTDALLDLVGAVYDAKDISPDTNINDVITFGSRLTTHIFGHKYTNDEGEEVFKEIESHKDLKPLTYKEKRDVRNKLMGLKKEINKHQKKSKEVISQLEDLDITEEKAQSLKDELKAMTDDIDKLIKDIRKDIIKMSNLKTKDMSDWEEELLYQKLIANANGSYAPVQGKK